MEEISILHSSSKPQASVRFRSMNHHMGGGGNHRALKCALGRPVIAQFGLPPILLLSFFSFSFLRFVYNQRKKTSKRLCFVSFFFGAFGLSPKCEKYPFGSRTK